MAESTHVPTYFFFSGSKPTVWIALIVVPITLLSYSETAQKLPSMRAFIVPVHLSVGPSGLATPSESVSHSPTNCCSHSCSFCGFGNSICSWARIIDAVHRTTSPIEAIRKRFMDDTFVIGSEVICARLLALSL